MHGWENPFRRVLESLGAQEATVWRVDDGHLVPAWNSGPNAEAILASYKQPLSEGLISIVCLTEQAICENEVYRNAGQDPTLDRTLGVLTCSMMAVPLRVGGEVSGVVSCVKLKKSLAEEDPPPFSQRDLERFCEAVRSLEEEMS